MQMHRLIFHALSAKETLISVQKKTEEAVVIVEVSPMQNLCNQQLEDELVSMVFRAKEKHIKPSEREVKSMSSQAWRLFQIWNQLKVSGDCLYQKYINPVDGHHALQLVVPVSIRDNVLRDLHEGVMAGHLGEDKT